MEMSRRDICTAGSTSSETHGRSKIAGRRTEAGETLGSDAEESISILIALARPCADKYWHQRLPWFVNRMREKPLEVSHGARLLPRLFRQISWESIAAIPRTVPPLAEPSVSMGNESNATIAIW